MGRNQEPTEQDIYRRHRKLRQGAQTGTADADDDIEAQGLDKTDHRQRCENEKGSLRPDVAAAEDARGKGRQQKNCKGTDSTQREPEWQEPNGQPGATSRPRDADFKKPDISRIEQCAHRYSRRRDDPYGGSVENRCLQIRQRSNYRFVGASEGGLGRRLQSKMEAVAPIVPGDLPVRLAKIAGNQP